MKKILFVRHAKSSWSDMSMQDHDRPLNSRGKRDAPKMAKRCYDMQLPIDLLVSSTAVRAHTTAKMFQQAYNLKNDIQLESILYHGDVSDYEEVITRLNDEINAIAIFGHNPGLTYLANELDSNRYIDNVPTSGVVMAEFNSDFWEDFTVAKSIFKDFYYPKQLI